MDTAWIAGVAAALGALGGHLLKELLPAMALEDWRAKRQLAQVFRKYRDPIVLSAVELAHRLGEVEREYPTGFLSSDVAASSPATPASRTREDPYFLKYKLDSTVYRLCAFLGWLELYRLEIVFLDSGKSGLNKKVDALLKKFRSALADGHLNRAPDFPSWSDDLIFREEQRAVGEVMIVLKEKERLVQSYGGFMALGDKPDEQRWLTIAQRFFLDLQHDKDFRRVRIWLLIVALVDLVEGLDTSRLSDRLREIRDRCQTKLKDELALNGPPR